MKRRIIEIARMKNDAVFLHYQRTRRYLQKERNTKFPAGLQ